MNVPRQQRRRSAVPFAMKSDGGVKVGGQCGTPYRIGRSCEERSRGEGLCDLLCR